MPTAVERSGADGIRIESSDCAGPFSWDCDLTYDIALPDGFDLDLVASSGSLTVRDLSVTRLREEVSSGDVDLVGVTGPIEISASSGEIVAQS